MSMWGLSPKRAACSTQALVTCVCVCVCQGQTVTVDTSKLAIYRKHVRPINMQDRMESRRLWHHVTESLHQDDIDKATEHKRIVS